MHLEKLFVQIESNKIGMLKFFLEAYDGLALMSTIDVTQGVLKIVYPPERGQELRDLLRSVPFPVTFSTDALIK